MKVWLVGMIVSYVFSFLSMATGFYKMLVYSNPSANEIAVFGKEPMNTYVSYDAYNFIINANYATAWFALAIFFAIIAFTFMYVYTKEKEGIVLFKPNQQEQIEM
jgi:hypothetical protein